MKQKLSQITALIKKNVWLVLLAVLGLTLVLFSGADKTADTAPSINAESYRTSLEASVKALCERTEGVKEATVLITLASTECAIYEKNIGEKGETLALSGGKALLIGYAYPEISGVAVVCDGAENESVKARLTLLLSASLSIPTTKIHIAPAK